MHNEEKINESMGKVVDYGNDIIKDNPMFYLLVGTVMNENGSVDNHYSCTASSKMSELDPEEDCYRVVATAIKGMIIFLDSCLGNKEHASEVFTKGLLEAMKQTRTNVLHFPDEDDDKYGFKKIYD